MKRIFKSSSNPRARLFYSEWKRGEEKGKSEKEAKRMREKISKPGWNNLVTPELIHWTMVTSVVLLLGLGFLLEENCGCRSQGWELNFKQAPASQETLPALMISCKKPSSAGGVSGEHARGKTTQCLQVYRSAFLLAQGRSQIHSEDQQAVVMFFPWALREQVSDWAEGYSSS